MVVSVVVVLWCGQRFSMMVELALVRVNGALNAQIYQVILQHDVVPLIIVTGGIFQQDNVRTHIAKIFYSKI